MILDGNSLQDNFQVDSDICIIGGGVAGIVLANELKKNFSQIILIESGTENYTPEAQGLYKPEQPPSLGPDPSYSRLRFLGGTSNHWENNTSPLSPIDFEQRDWIPNSGWPIKLDDLSDYYLKAQDYCGVDTDSYNTPYWANKLGNTDLLKESKVMVSRVSKFSNPPVRFFHEYGQKLIQSDNVTIYKNTNLIDIEFNLDTKKISAAIVQSNNGKKGNIQASTFILCLGGIENARMMLIFNDKYKNKLGNKGDNVGRYFMEHPTPRAAQLFVEDDSIFDFYKFNNQGSKYVQAFMELSPSQLALHQTTNLRIPLVPASNFTMSDGISSSHILKNSLSDGELPNNFGSHLYNVLSDLDMVVEGIARKNFDQRLFDHADKVGGFQLPMMMEQTPDRNNRVYLGSTKDKFGLKKILMDYHISKADKKRVWKTLDIVASEVGATNLGRLKKLKERSDRIWSDQLGFSNHHMGTTRMSNSENDGVVDKNLLVFGTDNLFIGGSSVFPTGGHVPPTLTIVALAIRLSNFLSKGQSNAENG